MKILRALENKYLKFFIIIISCYLIASLGVNRVANPLYYFTENEEHPLDCYYENSRLYISLKSMTESDSFVNINIVELQRFGSVVYLYSDTIKNEKTYALLSRGRNSIKISDLPLNDGTIYIKLSDLETDKMTISQVTSSSKRDVDTFSMLKIFVSLIFLVMFWKVLSSVKKKYIM